MDRIPVIDMAATGINITRMRVNAGLTVKNLQDIFGFSTPQGSPRQKKLTPFRFCPSCRNVFPMRASLRPDKGAAAEKVCCLFLPPAAAARFPWFP